MSKHTNLVILAAGMGSRFGGLKQIAPVGPNGEAIIDFSVYDAKTAGFDRAVIIIKKEIEKDFREAVGKRLEKMIDVEYAFQEVDKLPSWFEKPEGRTRPWGTTHAILCAKNVIDGNFAVINSDDYYGQSAYKVLYDYITTEEKNCMVGFEFGKTISENGTVNRGICKVEDGYLVSVDERIGIDANSGIPLDTIVSMNMWGFNHSFLDSVEDNFEKFLHTVKDKMKDECYLPKLVDDKIRLEGERVRVLTSPDRWYGVTYKEDTDFVVNAMKKLVEDGKYPLLGKLAK